MKTHTTLDLDRDLLAAAAEALGTSRTTDTVHAALRDAVARRARARLVARDWSNLKQLLPEMRAPRRFLPQPDETAAASDVPSVHRSRPTPAKRIRRSA